MRGGRGKQGACSAQGPDGERSARFPCEDGANFPQDEAVWDHVFSKNAADWKLGVIKQVRGPPIIITRTAHSCSSHSERYGL